MTKQDIAEETKHIQEFFVDLAHRVLGLNNTLWNLNLNTGRGNEYPEFLNAFEKELNASLQQHSLKIVKEEEK